LADGSLIEFDVNASGENYIDFANILMYVRAKLTAIDNTNLTADAAVGPVNLFLHSMFSQVDISLKGTLITSSTNTYPYRAVLETLLSYGEDAKTSQLTSALIYKDQAGVVDSIEFYGDVAARNSGLVKRRYVAIQSREFDMTLHACSCQDDNTGHCKISNATCGMQVVYDSAALPGRESREMVFREATHASRNWTRDQSGI